MKKINVQKYNFLNHSQVNYIKFACMGNKFLVGGGVFSRFREKNPGSRPLSVQAERF